MTVTVIATGFDKDKTDAVLEGKKAQEPAPQEPAPVAPTMGTAAKTPDPDDFLAEINKIFRD